MAVDMCFPLAKFSHALGLDASNNVPWTHIIGNDIFVILKGRFALHGAEPLTMTVMQGTAPLDVLNIAVHLAHAKQFLTSKERLGASYSTEHLPIFGIKRGSILALRCYVDGKARRLQLGMKRSEDCEQMSGLLSQLGLQFKEAQGPSTAQTNAKPANNSGIRRTEDPPLTAQASSYFPPPVNAPQPSPFSFPSMEAGSLSQHPPLSTRRPGQQSSDPLMTSGLPAERRVFTRDESLLPRTITPSQPSNEELWGNRTLRPPIQQSHAPLPGPQLNRSTLAAECTPSRSSVACLESIQRKTEAHDTGAGMRPPSSSMQPRQDISSDTIESRDHTPYYSSRPEPPSSSGMSKSSLAILETLEDEIPPRRELPFKIPGSRGSNSSRPGSSALSLPPLKRPTTADTRPSTAARPQTSSSKSANRAGNRVKETRPSTSHVTTQTTKKTIPHVQSNIPFAAAKRPMQELDSSSESYSTFARMSSLIDAPHELESPPCTSWSTRQAPAQLSTVPARALGNGTAERDAIAQSCGALPAAYQMQETSSLEEYAAQDGKTRQAALEQFMMDNLQDPSFTTLCEDMEGCWQRIALGL